MVSKIFDWILIAINKLMEVKMNQTIKEGWKTTEFWVSLATAIFGVLVTLGIFSADQASDITKSVQQFAGGIITAVSAAGYAISRGRTKSNTPPKE
jgi:uncharacterized protein (DUF697 family)